MQVCNYANIQVCKFTFLMKKVDATIVESVFSAAADLAAQGNPQGQTQAVTALMQTVNAQQVRPRGLVKWRRCAVLSSVVRVIPVPSPPNPFTPRH